VKITVKSISQSLSPSLKAFKPTRTALTGFSAKLKEYLEVIDHNESEENLKTHFMQLLRSLYGSNHLIEQQERIDFVIRTGGKKSPAGVLVESKRRGNKADMITKTDCNRKALHEIVLYYMRERTNGNTDIRHLIVCNEHEVFIFSSRDFELAFFKNAAFRRSFNDWAAGKKSDSTTDFFYSQIAKPYIAANEFEFEATHFNLNFVSGTSEMETQKQLLLLFKVLGPHHLLKIGLANDSNSLNKSFYDELLYIIGLEEKKEGSVRVIDRLGEAVRSPGSLIENTIAKLKFEDKFSSPPMLEAYGTATEVRAFNMALELCLTWVNRLLFLKLLEAQIVKFHQGDATYKFLNVVRVADFGELSDLFFMVLAVPQEDRPAHIQEKFGRVPYLNSSLFEKTDLEQILGVGSLNVGAKISVYSRTVLLDDQEKRRVGPLPSIRYIFEFLDSFDFGSVGDGDLQEDNKTIINASVLGLIFEKINGYKEGAIFTPGYITMHMSHKVIEKTVVETFAKAFPSWSISNLDDLRNSITDRSTANILKYNALIDDLKICDPAVGSGHFLVSCLNEIIAIKSKIGILADSEGNRLSDYSVAVDNDELIILNSDNDKVFAYQMYDGKVPPKLQFVQKTLFHEKQKLIENCLFGVDINPNSVRICQLRLWIELLKSAYYRDGTGDVLETLPNIDINIKRGNSLLSRFQLDQNLSTAFNKAGITATQYRNLVSEYKNSKDKALKKEINERIAATKERFQIESLGEVTKEIDLEIAALKFQEAQLDFFGLDDKQANTLNLKHKEIQSRVTALEMRKSEIIKKQTFRWALEWRFEFPEVLDSKGNFKGFDIIIANPPYMRVQEIEATQEREKLIYEQNFRTAKGSYDLANLFFELAGKLGNKDRHNNIFIFPHKLFNSANGDALREYLMNSRALKSLTHFGANQVFDSATTYTCIALFNAEKCDKFQFRRYSLGADYEIDIANDSNFIEIAYEEIQQASSLYGNSQWIFFDHPHGFAAFKKLFNASCKLAEKLNAFVGLQTSRDPLYVTEKIAEDNDHYTVRVNPDNKVATPPIQTLDFKVEKTFFRPFLMGGDVHRYEKLETNRLVFFPYQILKEPESVRVVEWEELSLKYPLTAAFVAHYKNVFKARENGKGGKLPQFYAYIYEKNLVKFDQPKLTSMEICTNHPNITFDPNSLYHTTKVYSLVKNAGVTESYPYFAAVLNSKVFWWFLKMTGDTLFSDARTVKTNYINPFPIPKSPNSQLERKLAILAQALMAAKADGPDPLVIAQLENEIDDAVFELYGLNSTDIEAIARTLQPS
jgi:adenine-specific DNA-methyltransferase